MHTGIPSQEQHRHFPKTKKRTVMATLSQIHASACLHKKFSRHYKEKKSLKGGFYLFIIIISLYFCLLTDTCI